MHRNVTAVYRNYATADMVCQKLADLGISQGRIHAIPDRDEPADAAGRRDDNRHIDALRDLNLPDDDLRTYQHSVNRGDYVVSVEVDEDRLAGVQEVMRRPETETYDLEARASEFRDEPLVDYDADRAEVDPERRGERDAADSDPYVRGYRRNSPLPDREPK